MRRATMHYRPGFGWTCGIALALAACGGASDHTRQTINLSNADLNTPAGGAVMAAIGDTIVVRLQTVGPGQYGTPIVSSAVVVSLGNSFVGPPVPAGPTQEYRFEAVASGRADITIPHTGDEGNVPSFVITVQVE